jgi:predicted permease
MVRHVLATLRNLVRRTALEQDLDAELAAAIDALAEEKRRQGLPAHEAVRQAAIEMGGVEQVKERVRDVRAGSVIDGVWSDARFAMRLFARQPAFALVAVATLALGIGATTTVYGWARRTLLEPLPGVPRQHELTVFAMRTPDGEFETEMGTADFEQYQRSQRAFVGLYGSRFTAANLQLPGEAERLWCGLVTGDFFRVLDVRPARGRVFGPDAVEATDGGPVVVISDALWRSRFHADEGVVGRVITLNGTAHTVIGVMPPGFVGGKPAIALSFWAPLSAAEPIARDRLQPDEVYGRLKPGVSITRATADLAPLAQEVEKASGRAVLRTLALFPLWQVPGGGSAAILRPLIAILGAVVGLVLILTCANVSSLLLTHAVGREHEMAVRVALGAGRWRLARQLGIESLLLAAAGGLGGVAIAHASSNLLLAFLPPLGLPYGLALGLDWPALGFAAGATLACAALVGLAPALIATRSTVLPSLNAESPWASGGRRRTTVRHALVAAQVALSMILIVTASLFLRSLVNAGTLQPGFDPKDVLAARVDLGPSGYSNREGLALFARLLDRVKAIPGVESATLASRIPLTPFNRDSTIIAVDGFIPRDGESLEATLAVVAPDYFRVLRIPMRAGRVFSPDDVAGRPLVAVVNEAMARRFWPDRDPLGRTFRQDGRTFTVVGVAADVKSYSIGEPPRSGLYLPALQEYWEYMYLVVRTAGDPNAVAPAIRSAVRAVDRGLPVADLQALTEYVRLAFLVQRVGGTVLGVTGVVALLLAALGLYGVVSYSVWRRVREFGVRMALGATPREIRRLVVGQGVRLFAIGAPVGLVGAVGLGLAARSQLYGVSFADPVSFGAAIVLLAIVVVTAAGIPAWRAGRLNVVRALRNQ